MDKAVVSEPWQCFTQRCRFECVCPKGVRVTDMYTQFYMTKGFKELQISWQMFKERHKEARGTCPGWYVFLDTTFLGEFPQGICKVIAPP